MDIDNTNSWITDKAIKRLDKLFWIIDTFVTMPLCINSKKCLQGTWTWQSFIPLSREREPEANTDKLR